MLTVLEGSVLIFIHYKCQGQKDRAFTNGNHVNIEFKNSLSEGEMMIVLDNIGYTYMCTYILSNVNDEHRNKTFVLGQWLKVTMQFYMSLCVQKTNWVPTRSDTYRPVQQQKMARSLKFQI